MATFGRLIDSQVPVLIEFYNEQNEKSDSMNLVVRQVVLDLAEKVKVIRIDADKNELLIGALNIKILPTIMIYNEGKKVFSKSGQMFKNEIVEILKPYIK
jgi:thioredoxin 1